MIGPLRSISAIIIAIMALALLVMVTLKWWNSHQSDALQSRVDTGQAGASINAGVSALDIVRDNGVSEAEIDQQVKDGIDVIRNATGASLPISPASRDAALCASCRMRSYRDTRRCTELLAAAVCQRPNASHSAGGPADGG